MYSLKKILIVDDNAINRKILRKILSDEYAILEATNGKEALDILEDNSGHIDGILLDIMMPVMNGFEFLRRINMISDYKNIPVIVSSEDNDRKTEKTALSLGTWDFVTKPYDADIIKFRLKNVITRSQLTAFKQLKYLAEYDALTGIYNKTKFFSATKEMLLTYNDKKFAFFRFDIARFALINSFYGNDEGDRLLKYIGEKLIEYGRGREDFTYGRIEADTFAFCTSYENDEYIYSYIRKCQNDMRRFNISFDIVPTFGIYRIIDKTLSVDYMLDLANLAAKQIKDNYVRNFNFYNEDMKRNLLKEQEITNDMSTALENEEFQIYFQPKYSVLTERPAGAEALVRWLHPKKGLIPPSEFIPIFEKNGFVEKLDYYMWEKACIYIRRWLNLGYNPGPVSVNVSRVNLFNPRLVDIICSLTEKYRVPNSFLNLELTESVYVDNKEMIESVISDLHSRGFIIMMDDFGSGYSSLNILKDIDIDVIKIDMEFLADARIEGRGESIISSVIRMAKWLDIPVIAEGVEKAEQVRLLRDNGCEYVQGYYYARPMPAYEYEKLIKKYRSVKEEERFRYIINDSGLVNNRELV